MTRHKLLAATITTAATVLMALAIPACASAGVRVVRTAPPAPRVEIRTASPGSGHVWVAGSWRWKGHRHVWVAGKWKKQPRVGSAWIAGHWKRHAGGWIWVPGHWRQR